MIRQFVVPVVAEIYEKQRNRLGIDHLYYYDEDMSSPEGNAIPYGTTEEQVQLAQKCTISPLHFTWLCFKIK